MTSCGWQPSIVQPTDWAVPVNIQQHCHNQIHTLPCNIWTGKLTVPALPTGLQFLTQDFFARPCKCSGHAAGPHDARNVDDLLKWDVASVFHWKRMYSQIYTACPFSYLLFPNRLTKGIIQCRVIHVHFLPSPCLTFFLSLGGSFRAFMINDDAEGTTSTLACLFWITSLTVIFRPFQSPVALAMSSPTFFGDWKHKNVCHWHGQPCQVTTTDCTQGK